MARAETYGATRWHALGTDIHLLTADAAALAAAERMLRGRLAELDAVASRFRPDSEVRGIAGSDGRTTTVSPLLAELLTVALDAAEETRGLLDPAVGSALVDLGYDRDFADLATAGARPVLSARRGFRWTDLRFDPHRRTLATPPGLLLDLGATAKAYAADRAAHAIAARTRTGVLVNLGGDIAVAGPVPGAGWPVGVCHEVRHPSADETVMVHGGGLATSSTSARRWRHGTASAHHIVDPATSLPAVSRWRTVTVHADTCLAANVAATTAILLDDRALRWLTGRQLAARLASHRGPVVRLAGWPAEVG
ncbi:MAG: FAD:protein FMN transferase [Streptosporangiales bacterium]|nr:FAD:protein FMN transferase [Streptosporangiales bacterium]MBO0889568.1 FAD:protein FMN transferase [Acidothermales bacterium]